MNNLDYIIQNGELQHYGVLGMKWGVHRAKSKAASNERRRIKAFKLDKKSANAARKSEKLHAEIDLESANKKAVKAAKYRKKAAVLDKRALKTDNEFISTRKHQKAEKLRYKASKADIEGNAKAKTKGYGVKAMKYSMKSDRVAKKAAQMRYKIAKDEFYIQKMKKKVSEISDADLQGAYKFAKELKTL